MALTNNQQSLIKAVAENDLLKAKASAKACLAEDTTQKNRYFVTRYKQILDNEPALLEVPLNLKGKLIAEDVSETFKESRYYLSPSEAELFREIRKMKTVSERLMELGVSYINATMLSGEPGVGKTEFGRYTAFKLGSLPFIYVNFSQLIDSLMGKTSSNLNLIFNYVKATPRCVFMLDEIDCIAMKRGHSTSGDNGPDGELSRTVVTLMQEFDSLPNGIIVIAATNRIDKIDPAFLSRFSITHEIKAFDEEGSMAMVNLFLEDIGYTLPQERIRSIIKEERVQRKIMKAVIREIGDQIYNELYQTAEAPIERRY